MPIRRFDVDELRSQFAQARPFPFIAIDDFLESDFSLEVANAYPTFDEAQGLGRRFEAVNERRKVQITNPGHFPPPVRRLHDALSSPEFLRDISSVTGIPNLIADEDLVGGGMHVTGPGGRLDVHVDFNYVRDRDLYRRLNILVYLNPEWQAGWGGEIELWDQEVKHCVHSLEPILNRCVLFATSEISYHGVTPLRCPPDVQRKSFAAYYYTREAPEGWAGRHHSTLFQARPKERGRRWLLMPAERARRRLQGAWDRLKQAVKHVIGG